MRMIDKLVVHCSASPDAMDIGFEEINSWHKDRGFHSISGIHCGYHYIIRRSGVIEVGRMPHEIGAHVQGANGDSLGICLVGTHDFAKEQIDSLKRIIDGLLWLFPDSKIFGHKEFESAIKQGKTCPNLDVHQVLGVP